MTSTSQLVFSHPLLCYRFVTVHPRSSSAQEAGPQLKTVQSEFVEQQGKGTPLVSEEQIKFAMDKFVQAPFCASPLRTDPNWVTGHAKPSLQNY